MSLSRAGCAGEIRGVRRFRLGRLGKAKEHDRRAVEQLGQHPIEFSCSTQHVVALSSGDAELYATGRAAIGWLQSEHLLTEAGIQRPKNTQQLNISGENRWALVIVYICVMRS